MARFMLIYLGGEHSSDPVEGKEHLEKYRMWLSSLGDAVVSPANPLKDTTVIHPDGTVTPGSTSAMSGFTILEANSQEAVIEMAKSCPFLEIGGTLEVSELVQMGS